MKIEEKIEKIKKDLIRLEEQQNELLMSYYAQLVGKCFHLTDKCWVKILKINRVAVSYQDSKFIEYMGFIIYFDEALKTNSDCSVSNYSIYESYVEELEGREIPESKFIEIFHKAVNFLKNRIDPPQSI